MRSRELLPTLLGAAALLLPGCWDHPPMGETGDVHVLGHGALWTDVQPGDDGPEALIFTFTQGALEGLPDEELEDIVPLPGACAPFNHLALDWEPHGHPPPTWSVPHFDLHLYMLAPGARRAIEAGPPSTAAPDLLPAGFAPVGATLEYMGQHWSNAPSLARPLTAIPVYGTHDGGVIFLEVMVSLATLKSADAVELDVPQPLTHARPGSYPTHCTIRTDPATGDRVVRLDRFEHAP